MSIKYYDKSQSTPQEVLLAGTPQTDQILNPSSKNAIANKTVYNALSEKVSKAVNDLVNYYTKSDVYNKQEIRELIGAIDTLTMEVVNALPSSDISTTTIYLLKQTGSSNYDEYVYINNEWVKIGTTQIDLSGYVTTSQLNQAIADFLTETEINLLLSAKQDKNLSSSVTIGSETVGTVEDAISEVADVIPSTVSASNKLATQGDIVNIEIDDSLSSTSENPVQNKVLKSALDAKQSSTLSSPIGGETTVEGSLSATDAALSNYINFAGAKNMLPCFLGNRLQYGIDFALNDDGSITMNGTSTGNPAYYAFAGENNGTANSPLLYKLAEVGLNKFLSFKIKITDTAIVGVGLRIYFYDSTGTVIPNPNTSTNYINCSTSVTIDFNTGYYRDAEYVAFMLAVSKDTVLNDATVYPLIYEINEYIRNSAYFPWAMTNRDLTTDGLKHTSWTDISKVGAVNFLENNAVTTVDSTAGLTYTVNADKSVTVSATSGEYPFTVLANSNLVLYEADGSESYVGKQIKISGCPKGGSDAYHIQAYRANSVDGSTGTIKEYGNGVIFDWLNNGSGIKAKVSVVLRKDLIMDGPLEFYPMLTLTNYQGDYASYAKTNKELTNDTIRLLDNVNKNGAKNLLPNNASSKTSGNVTFTVNPDGSILTEVSSAPISADTLVDVAVLREENIPKGRYIISHGFSETGYNVAVGAYNNTTWVKNLVWNSAENIAFDVDYNGYNSLIIRIGVTSNTSLAHLSNTFYPMIRIADDADDTYVPYTATNKQITQSISNSNLFDNPWFTINQRGITNNWNAQYTYGVDRWMKSSSTASTLGIGDNGIYEVDGKAYSIYILFDKNDVQVKRMYGKTLTFSALFSDGVVESGTLNLPLSHYIPSSNIIDNFIFNSNKLSYARLENYASGSINFAIAIKAGNVIRAVKLEVGLVSTLANDTAPNYQQELAKCQRYFYRFKASTSLTSPFSRGFAVNATQMWAEVNLPTNMRTTPTMSYNLLSDFKYSATDSAGALAMTGLSLGSMAGNCANLLITDSNHTLTIGKTYIIYMQNSGAYIDFSSDL